MRGACSSTCSKWPQVPPEMRECMAAADDTELNLTLGELGLVRSVRTRRRRAFLEVALPVAAWPSADALADEIHRVALTVTGVEEEELDFVVMGEDARGKMRERLRTGMLGVALEAPDDDDGHGHAHGHGHGEAAPMPLFL